MIKQENKVMRTLSQWIHQKKESFNLTVFALQIFSFSAFIALLINIWTNSPNLILTHDVVDFIAEANQFLLDKTLYSSFFNINPPFLIIFYVVWGFLFGFGLYGLKILNIILVMGIFLVFYKILLKSGYNKLSLVVFNVAVALTYTRNAFQMFLPSESIGTLIALVCLYLSLGGSEKFINLVSVGILSALAMQTKEVYAFVILTPILVCFLHQKPRYSRLGVLLTSFVGTNLILALTLHHFNELDSYWDVITLKSERFGLSDWKNTAFTVFVMLYRQLQLLGEVFFIFFILVISLAVYNFSRGPKRDSSQVTKNKNSFILKGVGVNWIATFIGVIWQNNDFSVGRVLITILFPFLLFVYFGLVNLFSYICLDKLHLRIACLVMISTLLFSIYSRNYYKPADLTDQQIDRSSKNYTIVNNLNLPSNACIQNAYGWMSGGAYLYTGIKPCSRYFLLNLIIKDSLRLNEFKWNMVSHPPSAIIYDNSDADLDWQEFEHNFFDYSKILKNCYLNVPDSDVYVARFLVLSQSKCIRNEIGAQKLID